VPPVPWAPGIRDQYVTIPTELVEGRRVSRSLGHSGNEPAPKPAASKLHHVHPGPAAESRATHRDRPSKVVSASGTARTGGVSRVRTKILGTASWHDLCRRPIGGSKQPMPDGLRLEVPSGPASSGQLARPRH